MDALDQQVQPSLLHTTSTITHAPHYLSYHSHSTLPQPSLTLHTTSTITHAPHYLNHHSHLVLLTTSTVSHTLHTTSTITHNPHFLSYHSHSTLPQPTLTPSIVSQSSLTPSTLPQPSLTPHYLSHHSPPLLHNTSTITHGPYSTLP